MQNIDYTSRDFSSEFDKIKELMETIEPRVDVGYDKTNPESIIAKVLAGCVDTLSYNQDANILEAFPSTARDARAIFDLLSVVGYTPKTAKCSKIYLTLWNPSTLGQVLYYPYTKLGVDGKSYYSVDDFTCSQGEVTNTTFYQGTLVAPEIKTNATQRSSNFIENYYPNLTVSSIKQNQYVLPSSHTQIDSETISIYTEDGKKLTYVENPYTVFTTTKSFSLVPSVNSTGYSLVFSKDVSSGSVSNNFYYFYIRSEGLNAANNLTLDFSSFSSTRQQNTAFDSINNNAFPSFSYSYIQEDSKAPETASEARENIVYEFGWRDTPKAIVTKYDAERAVLQEHSFVAAVEVRDADDYSFCNPTYVIGEDPDSQEERRNKIQVEIFIKVTEEAEAALDNLLASTYKTRITTHLNKFKMLPLNFKIHIDDIVTEENEIPTKFYYWYPNVTIYLKEQVDPQSAGAILTSVYDALYEKYKYKNVDFNTVPKTIDVIETIQKSSDMILYLDVDGINFYYSTLGYNDQLVQKPVDKDEITCRKNEQLLVPSNYEIDKLLDNTTTIYTKETNEFSKSYVRIKPHTLKIIDETNTIIGYENGAGEIVSQTGYVLGKNRSLSYTSTGQARLLLTLTTTPPGSKLNIYYELETVTYCKFANYHADSNGDLSIKIALESLKS